MCEHFFSTDRGLTYIIANFICIFQRARKLDKFGGKMTKFEDIGVDLNKVNTGK